MRRPRPRVLGLLLVLGVALPTAPAGASGCATARSVSGGRNPSYAQVAVAIDAAAARRRVPPPVLKAIAWRESGWQQFWPDGRAKVSGDCGIGIMQITTGAWDYRRLASDYVYNVDAGAQVLAAKMAESSANVPTGLGPDQPIVLENWYRGAFRYNGWGSGAEAYADAIVSTVNAPPGGIAPWAPAVRMTSPKQVLPGYRPTSGHAYVARPDGVWVSSLGNRRGPVLRADWLAVGGALSPGRSLEGDQRAVAVLYARNVGWQPWTPARVRAATLPLGWRSRLEDPSWLSPYRPGAVQVTTPPGALGRFVFTVRAIRLAQPLSSRESFVPIVDDRLPLAGGTGGSTWSYQPVRLPTAEVSAAPTFVTDASTDSFAPISLRARDPAPGAGVAYSQVATRRVCSGCAWGVPGRVDGTSARVLLSGPGVHEVRVRAVDRADHVGAWSAIRRVIVPRDNTSTSLSYTGAWTQVRSTSSWLASVHAANGPNATMSVGANGATFAVIGIRGPGLAPLSIYVDGTLVAVVPTQADAKAYRQVLWRGDVTAGHHVVRVVVNGATAYLDAVAAV